jgi:Flp pilus assembly protein TadG
MIRRCVNRIASDDRGATILEFALVAPVMLLMIMGLGEISYEAYVQAVLSGSMQKAGRDSAIQSADTTAIDNKVLAQVQAVAPLATMIANLNGKPRRASYATFGYIQPEPFTDTNSNGIRDAGECYTDYNGNSQWDADPGTTGTGKAGDSVVYTITISYPRLFPLVNSMKWAASATTSATTIIKNQPYATQTVNAPVTICT